VEEVKVVLVIIYLGRLLVVVIQEMAEAMAEMVDQSEPRLTVHIAVAAAVLVVILVTAVTVVLPIIAAHPGVLKEVPVLVAVAAVVVLVDVFMHLKVEEMAEEQVY
tara:strand:+ start:427 stop:744 length:318 start_codon:yes stop_codon:yes gene_type:complete